MHNSVSCDKSQICDEEDFGEILLDAEVDAFSCELYATSTVIVGVVPCSDLLCRMFP